MDQLQDFRRQIDDFMKHHPQSPIDHDQRQQFTGLDYFDYNAGLVLEVDVDLLPEDEPVVIMQTSTGDQQQYRRFGQFTVTVGDHEGKLTIYSNPHGHEFFLPFRDATSGKGSYGAGRYMDDHRPAIQRLGRNRFRIDFNYAYNPYCAYNPYFSCPLPPAENWLQIPIRAGEKAFEK